MHACHDPHSRPVTQYEDLVGSSDKLMRKLADEQMGPLLAQMGVSEDPFDFFIDLIKVGQWEAIMLYDNMVSHTLCCR